MRRVLLGVVILVAVRVVAADLGYQIPTGWIDLTRGNDGPPVADVVIAEARSGKFKIYAIDPDAVTPQGATPVSMNVIELPKPLRITPNTVRAIAAETMGELETAGVNPILDGSEVLHIGSAPVGHYWYRGTYNGFHARQDQYVISGKTGGAVITFTCPPHLYGDYAALFNRTVLLTSGATTHRLINWSQVFFFAALGAVIAGGLVVLVIARGKTVAPPVPVTWDCPTCKRRVPVRLGECRCGALKPA